MPDTGVPADGVCRAGGGAVMGDTEYTQRWLLFNGLEPDTRYVIEGVPVGGAVDQEITLSLRAGDSLSVVTSTTLLELLGGWAAEQLTEPVTLVEDGPGKMVARCAGTHGAYRNMIS